MTYTLTGEADLGALTLQGTVPNVDLAFGTRVVAGGGSGGGSGGGFSNGGGGGGGVVGGQPSSKFTATVSTYTITVGAGGATGARTTISRHGKSPPRQRSLIVPTQ